MEKRKTRRIKRRAQCQIRNGRKQYEGLILDISEGGLAVLCSAEFDEATTIEVEFAGLGKPLAVSALVWHRRNVRYREEQSFAYGCIVENPAPDYLQLLPAEERNASSSSAEPKATGPQRKRLAHLRAELSQSLKESATEIDPRTFRVRVRHRTSPRTKTLTLVCASEEEARAAADQSLGGEWDLIEVLEAE